MYADTDVTQRVWTENSTSTLDPRLTPRVSPDEIYKNEGLENDTKKTWIVRLYESLQCRN